MKHGSTKILFLVESLAVAAGGTALEVATLARELAKVPDFEVTVVTCQTVGPDYTIGDRAVLRRIGLPRLDANWLRGSQPLKALLADQDVVFCTGIWGPYDGLGLRLAWPRKARVYIRVCGMLEPYILARNAPKKCLGRAFYVNHNLSRAAGLIVNSSPEADRVKALGFGTPVAIIPNGVPPPEPAERTTLRHRLGIAPSRTVLLYLGRIHPKKGLDLWLEAWQARLARGVDLERDPVLMVGGAYSDPAFQSRIQSLAEPFERAGHLHFLGELAGLEKEEAFAAADAFLLPSQSEGLPNAVLEAMARKLPACITPGCNIPEIGDYDAGWLLDYSLEGMMEAQDWMVANCGKFMQMGCHAERLVRERFSLERSIRTYEEIVRDPQAFPTT